MPQVILDHLPFWLHTKLLTFISSYLTQSHAIKVAQGRKRYRYKVNTLLQNAVIILAI